MELTLLSLLIKKKRRRKKEKKTFWDPGHTVSTCPQDWSLHSDVVYSISFHLEIWEWSRRNLARLFSTRCKPTGCLPLLGTRGTVWGVFLLTCLGLLQSEQNPSCHPSTGHCGARCILEKSLWHRLPPPSLGESEGFKRIQGKKCLHKHENDHPYRSPFWSMLSSLVLQTGLLFLVFERIDQFFLSSTSIQKA